jgi:hypothetical protein
LRMDGDLRTFVINTFIFRRYRITTSSLCNVCISYKTRL